MFKNMALKKKIVLGFLSVIALTAILAWRSIANMDNLNNEISNLKENQFKPTKLIGDANIALLAWNRGILKHIIASNPDVLMQMEKVIADNKKLIDENLKALETTNLSEKGSAILAKVQDNIQKTSIYEEKILRLSREGAQQEARKVLNEQLVPIVNSADVEMSNFISLQEKQFEAAIKATDAMYAKALMVMSILIASCLVLGIVFSLVISNSVIKPFKELFKGLTTFSSAELEELASELNTIVEDLRSGSRQVEAASGNISEASQILSTSSNSQAATIEENSAALEEISGMVEKNVSSSDSANKLSDDVGGDMKELVDSFSKILDSNTQIEGLVKVIGEIGEKTKVIDEIVFQTKMLSFNASVEAERAGEHGRGFAIVAQEVGNLADMSGKAALEISEIVKDSIKQAEGITTENSRRVERGDELAKGTLTKSEELSTGAKQIYDASKEQAKGINQINDTLATLSKSTQELATTAEEAASSSEELNGQAEQLNRIVAQMIRIMKGDNANSNAPKRNVPSKAPEKTSEPINRRSAQVLSFKETNRDFNRPGEQKVVANHGANEDAEKMWEAL